MTAPRRRVLVIDDERLIAEAVVDVLSDDHDVALAGTVARACVLLAEQAFDVVLCDLLLPDGTAADVMRAWPAGAARFVFITGGTDDRELLALLAGARGRVLHKPFDLYSLGALVSRVAAG